MSQAGVVSSTLSPLVPISFVEDVGSAAPAAGILKISGGVGITTSGAGNTVTITAIPPTSFGWTSVTSANNPVLLTTQNGYITKGNTSVHFILPAAAAIGDNYRIIGYGNLWSIAQNAGQTIRIGSSVTTAGVLGSVTATMATDCLDIICVTSNLEFFCDVVQGNPKLT